MPGTEQRTDFTPHVRTYLLVTTYHKYHGLSGARNTNEDCFVVI